MQRVVITGSSGYLGRKLVATLLKQGKTVLGIDITNAPDDDGPSQFYQADICDENLLGVVRNFAPDTIVHAAFIVKPIRNTKRMTAVNIGGTDNMIRIVRELRPNRFLFVSSATALGAWPDNPIPLPDTWIPRARPEFQYAADKTALEGKVSALAAEIPYTAVSWIRPAVVGGPKMDNYLSRFIFNNPMLVKIDGEDSAVQFVHEDDVVGATYAILEADARGPFNVAPADWTTVSLIAGETNRRTFHCPSGSSGGQPGWHGRFTIPSTNLLPGFSILQNIPGWFLRIVCAMRWGTSFNIPLKKRCVQLSTVAEKHRRRLWETVLDSGIRFDISDMECRVVSTPLHSDGSSQSGNIQAALCSNLWQTFP